MFLSRQHPAGVTTDTDWNDACVRTYTYVPYIGLAFLFTMLASEYLKRRGWCGNRRSRRIFLYSISDFQPNPGLEKTAIFMERRDQSLSRRIPAARRARAIHYSKATMIDEAAAAQLLTHH